MSCAFEDCGDPTCPVCTIGRGPQTSTVTPPADLKKSAPALNGTKPARTVRDPRFIKRRRKAL